MRNIRDTTFNIKTNIFSYLYKCIFNFVAKTEIITVNADLKTLV